MTLQCIQIARVADLSGERPSGKEALFRCPRHDDHHPSLSINREKNVWLYGPCGKSGNACELAAFILGIDSNNRCFA
jgi:DNA primase